MGVVVSYPGVISAFPWTFSVGWSCWEMISLGKSTLSSSLFDITVAQVFAESLTLESMPTNDRRSLKRKKKPLISTWIRPTSRKIWCCGLLETGLPLPIFISQLHTPVQPWGDCLSGERTVIAVDVINMTNSKPSASIGLFVGVHWHIQRAGDKFATRQLVDVWHVRVLAENRAEN